jgi:hypothetical protein
MTEGYLDRAGGAAVDGLRAFPAKPPLQYRCHLQPFAAQVVKQSIYSYYVGIVLILECEGARLRRGQSDKLWR